MSSFDVSSLLESLPSLSSPLDWKLLPQFTDFLIQEASLTGKNDAARAVKALEGFAQLASNPATFTAAEPFLALHLPAILKIAGSKTPAVRNAAVAVVETFRSKMSAHDVREVLTYLFKV